MVSSCCLSFNKQNKSCGPVLHVTNISCSPEKNPYKVSTVIFGITSHLFSSFVLLTVITCMSFQDQDQDCWPVQQDCGQDHPACQAAGSNLPHTWWWFYVNFLWLCVKHSLSAFEIAEEIERLFFTWQKCYFPFDLKRSKAHSEIDTV